MCLLHPRTLHISREKFFSDFDIWEANNKLLSLKYLVLHLGLLGNLQLYYNIEMKYLGYNYGVEVFAVTSGSTIQVT